MPALDVLTAGGADDELLARRERDGPGPVGRQLAYGSVPEVQPPSGVDVRGERRDVAVRLGQLVPGRDCDDSTGRRVGRASR